MVLNGRFIRKQREDGSCRVENTETKVENYLLDYPALSCSDVSAWTSSVVARERHLGPRRVQQRAVPTGPMKGSQQKAK